MRAPRRTTLSTVKNAGLAGLLIIGGACQSGPGPGAVSRELASHEADYLATVPPELREHLRAAITSSRENRVLREMELGTHALVLGDYDRAAASFDYALDRIEITHAGSEEAARARSLWYEEENKEFKGEPYERAMAYYYRGILFLKEGDYDNARAVFNGAILQDAFAEEHQYRCDFALMYLMAAYASHLMGDFQTRDEEFAALREFRPDYPEPAWGDVLLVVAETGKSPRKLGDGIGHYQMRLFRGRGFTDTGAMLYLDGNELPFYPTEDIAFQAMTRGARPIDAILEGQVQFRRSAERIGTTLTESAQTVMVVAPLMDGASSTLGAVAGGLGVIGVASAMVAQNAKPRADTRFWSSLPDTVHTIFVPKTARGSEATIRFLADDGSVVSEVTQTIPEDAVILWAKSTQH